MDVITRAEAEAKGLKRYFTGEPCKNGHRDERYVVNNGCCTCTYNRVANRRRKKWINTPAADRARRLLAEEIKP